MEINIELVDASNQEGPQTPYKHDGLRKRDCRHSSSDGTTDLNDDGEVGDRDGIDGLPGHSRYSGLPRSQTNQNPEPVMRNVTVRDTSLYSEKEIAERREALKALFASPWNCTRKNPCRMPPFEQFLRIFGVYVVLIQVILFSYEQTTFTEYAQTNKISFHHLFLKDWTSEREVLPYPPASGEYAVYTQKELFNHMEYALYQYDRFEEIAISPLLKKSNSTPCLRITYFTKVDVPANPLEAENDQSYEVDNTIAPEIVIPLKSNAKMQNCDRNPDLQCFSVQRYLNTTDSHLNFNRLINVTLNLSLSGIHVKVPKYTITEPLSITERVEFKIQINYDNSKKSGQIIVKLTTELDTRTDYNKTYDHENRLRMNALTGYTGFVILISAISCSLGMKSFFFRVHQVIVTTKLFKEHYGHALTIPERMEFMVFWYLQDILSDIFVIIASSFQIYMRYGVIAGEITFNNHGIIDWATIFLGLGSAYKIVGQIRYLVPFQKFNIVITTMNHAVPSMLRFFLCVLLIYAGFMTFGILVLGPYNPKFTTIALATQSLFSLINGDDIYSTMSIIGDDEATWIYVLSNLYLYLYIAFSIYALANLFIAVIMDSYEIVKSGEPFKKNFLHDFIDGTINDVDESPARNVEEVREYPPNL